MKQILIVGIVIIGMGGIIGYNTFVGNRTEVDNTTPVTTETSTDVEEVVQMYPDEVLEASENAKMAVLRAFDLEQDKLRITEEREAKKAEYDLWDAEQQTLVDDIDKELGDY